MRHLLSFALVIASPVWAQEDEDFDPALVSLTDAINCHIDAPTYNGFALNVSGEDGVAAQLGWTKVESDNPFLLEYELPEPIAVTGHWATRRVVFSSTAVLAILDEPDPNVVAMPEGIVNEMDPQPLIDELVATGRTTREEVESEIRFRKFLGQRVLADVTEPAETPDGFGTHTVIARSVSNVTSHPGKTLYGCSYRIELLDAAGKPM
ncbi:MAG: hypothetical protein Q8R81_09125 [Novosphingobium sp.]|uniref:hypothetical protein n=1 Tax=Novosphingobium sp. TaxID=1874826 RepID=UPI0027367990|nr:hypothetical protein [Novosphingobium sp.]MDP3550545.1 hypothetical protein [Novosphingobium sp.]